MKKLCEIVILLKPGDGEGRATLVVARPSVWMAVRLFEIAGNAYEPEVTAADERGDDVAHVARVDVGFYAL